MFGKGKKRKTKSLDTLIGQNTEIYGNIHFRGGLQIEGSVKGSVSADNDGSSALTVSDTGNISGDISVPYLDANGTITGEVRAYEHAELAPKTRIEGDVYYNLLEMDNGAEINGKLFHDVSMEHDSLPLDEEPPPGLHLNNDPAQSD